MIEGETNVGMQFLKLCKPAVACIHGRCEKLLTFRPHTVTSGPCFGETLVPFGWMPCTPPLVSPPLIPLPQLKLRYVLDKL